MTMTLEQLIKSNPHVAEFDALAVETLKDLSAGVKETIGGKMDGLDDWEDTCRKVTDQLKTSSDENENDPEINDGLRLTSEKYFQHQTVIWREISKPGFADQLSEVLEDIGKLKRTQVEYTKKANEILDQSAKNDTDFRRLLAVLGLPVSGPLGAIKLGLSEIYGKIRAKHLDQRYAEFGLKIRDDKLLMSRKRHWADYLDMLGKATGILDGMKDAVLAENFGRLEKVYKAVKKLAELLVDYQSDVDQFLEASGSPKKVDELRKLIDGLEDIGDDTIATRTLKQWIDQSRVVVQEYREELQDFLELSSQLRSGVFLRSKSKLSSESDADTIRSIEQRQTELQQLWHRLEQDIDVELRLMRKHEAELRAAANGDVSVEELLDDPNVERRVMDSGEIDIEAFLKAQEEAQKKK